MKKIFLLSLATLYVTSAFAFRPSLEGDSPTAGMNTNLDGASAFAGGHVQNGLGSKTCPSCIKNNLRLDVINTSAPAGASSAAPVETGVETGI